MRNSMGRLWGYDNLIRRRNSPIMLSLRKYVKDVEAGQAVEVDLKAVRVRRVKGERKQDA